MLALTESRRSKRQNCAYASHPEADWGNRESGDRPKTFSDGNRGVKGLSSVCEAGSGIVETRTENFRSAPVTALLAQLAKLEVLFIIAFVLALLINRPKWTQQQELFEKHGHNVVLVTTMIFAAGLHGSGCNDTAGLVTRRR